MKLYYIFAISLILSCNPTPSAEKENTSSLQEKNDQNSTQTSEHIKEYYEDGVLKNEGRLLNEKRNGLWKMYYPSGILWSESVYKEDILNGPTKVYYPSGVMRYQGRFRNGERVGKWVQYDEQGKVKHEDFFKD